MPLNAIMVVFICAALTGLINIGNSTAFGAIVSMLLEGFYSSYLLACGMRLYRRISGHIREPDAEAMLEQPYEWGPWHLTGYIGVANNIVACAYLILVVFFCYWPTTLPVNAENMNYSSLVLGSLAIFSFVYYLTRARKTYNGPVVEVQISQMRSHQGDIHLKKFRFSSRP